MIDVGVCITQGAAPHGQTKLGRGTSTIAQAGCLLSSLTMAARALTHRLDLGILDAQLLIDAHDGFAGSGLIVDRAARALGLDEVERGSFDLDEVRADLAQGRPVIVGIDFVPGHSSGFSSADHFVLAVAIDDDVLYIADPAYGHVAPIATVNTLYHTHTASLVEQIRLTARAV